MNNVLRVEIDFTYRDTVSERQEYGIAAFVCVFYYKSFYQKESLWVENCTVSVVFVSTSPACLPASALASRLYSLLAASLPGHPGYPGTQAGTALRLTEDTNAPFQPLFVQLGLATY